MPSPDSMTDKNDSYQGNSRKRKQMEANTSNSHAGNEGNSSNLPPRTIGEDGGNEGDAKHTTCAETLLTLKLGYEGDESNQAVPPRSVETVEENYVRLRWRQRQKSALRNRSQAALSGSRMMGSVRVDTHGNLESPDPLSFGKITPSIYDTFSQLHYRSKNFSMLQDRESFQWAQELLAGKPPGSVWLHFLDRLSQDLSKPMTNGTAVPHAGSNVASSSQSSERKLIVVAAAIALGVGLQTVVIFRKKGLSVSNA
ncbi:hypothetical protein M5689_018289 [Euphorbia peplus]|nr:hypothetical protein M5689_018289 [Euphorbia peplus]